MSVVRSWPYLESVDAKLDRAHHHYDIIHRDIEKFVKSAVYEIVPKFDLKTNESWLMWWAKHNPYPPISISVEIGEFLYNLRSALDNLVCALVRTQNNSSSCAGRSFPIHTDCNKFDFDVARMLKGVPPSARTLIQGLQPYSRGKDAADVDPLNILNQLRNRDAHRALNLGVSYNRNTRFTVLEGSTKALIETVTLTDRIFLSDGAQTIPLSIPASRLPTVVDVKTTTSSGICFLEDGPWAERTVDEVLVACMEYVENRVIARFKPFFNQ